MTSQQPASAPETAPGIDASPEPAASTLPPPSGPYAANLGDGANGLSETLAIAIDAEWMRPEHDCDGTDDSCAERCPRPAYQRMGLDELQGAAVAAAARIVREHTDRALAEVEQRIEHGPHRLGHNVSVVCSCVRCEATHACLAIVRAARQETGR